jgi:hypothetical protein
MKNSIQVGTKIAKLQGAQQSCLWITGFMQHPVVKLQPTQLAVEVVLRIAQINFSGSLFDLGITLG